jgi:hypothetical protein
MKTKEDIAEIIFEQFRKTNSKAGHIVMFRVFRLSIVPKLNPKEQELFFEVANKLIENQYIVYEDGQQSGLECFRLTEKGYEYIYDDDATLEYCFQETPLEKDPMIKETKDWLEKYPAVQKLYNEAIEKYKQKTYERNVLDDMRLSLETFLKEILKNQKSLENQLSEIGKYQKEKGLSVEFVNMFNKLLDYYAKYQNNYVKHNDAVNPQEIDFIIHLTTAFMRCFM